jgi:hypothetical protein
VKRIVVNASVAAALLSAAFVCALLFRPGEWRLGVDAWLLALGAVSLAGAVAATRGAHPRTGPSPLEGRRRKRDDEITRLPQVARLEREVEMGAGTAFDLHYRLRPVLRAIAEHRLAARRGLQLDSGDETVKSALGADLWDLVRPDRLPPRHHHDPGLSVPALRAAVETLERI